MTRHVRRWLAVPMILGLAFVTASCGGDDEGVVDVTLADFTITADPTSTPAGEVTFDVANDAEQVHEFVVFQTDLAAEELPTGENGDVDEEGEGVTLVDEIEDIEGGSSESLTVDLDAGSYVLICNLPGHYGQGMHTSFSVS